MPFISFLCVRLNWIGSNPKRVASFDVSKILTLNENSRAKVKNAAKFAWSFKSKHNIMLLVGRHLERFQWYFLNSNRMSPWREDWQLVCIRLQIGSPSSSFSSAGPSFSVIRVPYGPARRLTLAGGGAQVRAVSLERPDWLQFACSSPMDLHAEEIHFCRQTIVIDDSGDNDGHNQELSSGAAQICGFPARDTRRILI